LKIQKIEMAEITTGESSMTTTTDSSMNVSTQNTELTRPDFTLEGSLPTDTNSVNFSLE